MPSERNRAGILLAGKPTNHFLAVFLVLMVSRRQLRMQDHLASKAKWYKAKAIECAALARSARPNFVREIYRKAAGRYDFAEGVLRRRMKNVLASPEVA
jgi:hypothetical protein